MNIKDLRPARDFAQRFGVKSIVYGPAGSGKCLAPGTPVLMFDGSIIAVEYIKIGDMLMGPDSSPRLVTHLAHGFDDMFDIVPVKGMTYRVNKPHILSLWLSSRNYYANISVEQYFTMTEDFKRLAKGWRTGVEFPTKQVYLNPYLLGLWLGDGSSDELAFHTIDPPIVDFLEKISSFYSVRVKKDQINKCPRYRMVRTNRGDNGENKLKECFKYYSLFNNKHVPDDFKINSAEIRANVLAGLIDTDGYLGSNCFQYISKLERLADDVCYISRSLGLAAYKTRTQKKCSNGVIGDYFSVSISGDTWKIPTQLTRKQATPRLQKKNVLYTGITIEPAGYGEYYGFELSGPDKLFLLGDFTVTHNTPVINTAPRPLLLACEPGLLSMRNSTVPTFQAFTAKLIDDFFEWFFKSTETKAFDTIAVDSGSHMAEVYLTKAKGENKHGLKAYGEMAENTLEHLNGLYWMQEKHVYLIAKQEIVAESNYKRPYFPGRQLPIEMPHKYDQILQLDIHNIPASMGLQVSGPQKAFRCVGTIDILARDRTGMLAEYEPPDFGALVRKAMS